MPTDKVRDTKAPFRRPINVSLDAALIEEARALGINISRACEHGLAEEIAKQRRQRWLDENQEAIEGWNKYVEEHGLPLEKYRQF
jgi:antitoxin CcdA